MRVYVFNRQTMIATITKNNTNNNIQTATTQAYLLICLFFWFPSTTNKYLSSIQLFFPFLFYFCPLFPLSFFSFCFRSLLFRSFYHFSLFLIYCVLFSLFFQCPPYLPSILFLPVFLFRIPFFSFSYFLYSLFLVLIFSFLYFFILFYAFFFFLSGGGDAEVIPVGV